MKFRGNRGTLPVDRKQRLMMFKGKQRDTAIRIDEVQREQRDTATRIDNIEGEKTFL